MVAKSDNGIAELRAAAAELKDAVSYVKDQRGIWQPPTQSTVLHKESEGWNFTTFEKFINQRFSDLSLQLRERYEAQQIGLTAALAAAEKAVNAALVAAEKAVDKAEGAQQLRNEAQNEFRKSLGDLSALMWTIKEGTEAVASLRRELSAAISNLDKKVDDQSSARIHATETLRISMDSRLSSLETGYANIQGRIWAVSALFAILTLALNIGVKFIH